MIEIILEVKNLVKQFDHSVRAVDGISFSIKKGQILGLLGPNGAGKTTTIHMLVGILTPTSGTVSYFGKEFNQNKQFCLQRINFTSSYNSLQDWLTVWENLQVYALLYNVSQPKDKIMELVSYFEVEDLLHTEFYHLSSGQKTRINLIKTLLNDPELILMDEPTASLDPDIADKALTLIEKLKKERALSILFTSHNMDEVTRICDEVIFLKKGSIIAQGSPTTLIDKVGLDSLHEVFIHLARNKMSNQES